MEAPDSAFQNLSLILLGVTLDRTTTLAQTILSYAHLCLELTRILLGSFPCLQARCSSAKALQH